MLGDFSSFWSLEFFLFSNYPKAFSLYQKSFYPLFSLKIDHFSLFINAFLKINFYPSDMAISNFLILSKILPSSFNSSKALSHSSLGAFAQNRFSLSPFFVFGIPFPVSSHFSFYPLSSSLLYFHYAPFLWFSFPFFPFCNLYP